MIRASGFSTGSATRKCCGRFRRRTSPSFSFEDATANNALLEAMSSGLPIVATDVGGIREYVGEDAGILCPRKDPRALADGILTLLDDAVTREKMANASRSKALLLDFRVVADRMREIYTRVLMRRS